MSNLKTELETTNYVELRFVHVNKYTGASKNETVVFKKLLDSESFTISSGATEIKRGPKKAKVEEYPLNDWNFQLARFIKKGFDPISVKEIKTVEINLGGEFIRLEDSELQEFIESAIAANDELIKSNFSSHKAVRDIPKEHIKHAQETLIKLSEEKQVLSVAEFNDFLMKDIWTYIPRAMSNASKLLATKQEDFEDIITREQEILDNICLLLRNKDKKETAHETILSINNLEARAVSFEEEKFLKDLMTDRAAQFKRAWKVKNKETEKAFYEFCEEHGLTEENGGINHLFHGTGFENVWSIFKNGLYLNPAVIKSNVRICGKAFGYGLYFAPYCGKSMNYASTKNARHYKGGNSNVGYLLVFKVATGEPYYIYRDLNAKRPNHWADFSADHPGKLCCWAERGGPNLSCGLNQLAMEEVIVYQEKQATIEYIIEFKD